MKKYKKQQGFVTLAAALALLFGLSVVAMFTAGSVINEQKVANNVFRSEQAFSAAQAGLAYGVVYLEKHRSTVTNGQVITGTLANGASYSVVLNFVGANSNHVKLVSTGKSTDNEATRKIAAHAKYHQEQTLLTEVPLKNKGSVKLKDNSTVRNLHGVQNIVTSSNSVVIQNNAFTRLANGVISNSNHIGNDIEVSNGEMAARTALMLQQDSLGEAIQNYVTSRYNQLLQNATVHYGNLTIQGRQQIGSPSNPHNLIVYGAVKIRGNAKVYGTIYSYSYFQVNGNAEVFGDLIAGGNGCSNYWGKISGNAKIQGDVYSLVKTKVYGNGLVFGNLYSSAKVSLSGNTAIFGLLLSLGKVTMAGNNCVVGAVITTGNFISQDNAQLVYEPNNLGGGQGVSGKYGIVPGTWQDLGV